MRAHVNEQIIERKTTAARRASMVGLSILVAAVIVSFRPSIPYYIAVAYTLSLIGLIVVTWSSQLAVKWIGELRGDTVLAKALKGLSGEYSLYNYMSPADHVLVSWSGLTILALKRTDGAVTCRGGRWRRPWSLGRIVRALGEEQLGNPTQQAEAQVKALRTWLQVQLPDADVAVEPVIVFIHPKAKLDVFEPAISSMLVGDLKDYLRSRPAGKKLTPQVFKALTKLLDDYAA
jgi:hypothetical protein